MTQQLEGLIEETMIVYSTHQEQQKARAEEARKKLEAESARWLYEQLQEAISPEVLESLSPLTYHHAYQNANHAGVSASFPYLGYDWRLSRSGDNTWNISLALPGSSAIYSHRKYSIPAAQLQTALLLELGKHREGVRKSEEECAARNRYDEAQAAERRRLEAEWKREQQERIAQAELEHRRLTALFAGKCAGEEQKLWRWPEGVTVEIYHLEWCRGSYRDDDDDTNFDYDTGWTSVSALDARGRIALEAARRSYSSSAPRIVQLTLDIHKPVWTVYACTGTRDLPPTLTEEVNVSLPGVALRGHSTLDGKTRLEETDRLDYDEEWYSKTIGQQPLAWIRDLADRLVTSVS